MSHGSPAQVLHTGLHVHQHPFTSVEYQVRQQGLEQGVAFTSAAAPGAGQGPHDQQAFVACCFRPFPHNRQRGRQSLGQIADMRIKIHHTALASGTNAFFNQCGALGEGLRQISPRQTRGLPERKRRVGIHKPDFFSAPRQIIAKPGGDGGFAHAALA